MNREYSLAVEQRGDEARSVLGNLNQKRKSKTLAIPLPEVCRVTSSSNFPSNQMNLHSPLILVMKDWVEGISTPTFGAIVRPLERQSRLLEWWIWPQI